MRISYMQIMNNLMQTGLTVSLAALVPLLLRRVLKKRYPARAVCLVWALLALRLLVPVQLTLPEADVLLEDGDKVEEAGLCFEVLHTPGHTPGSVCYQHEKTLFCGDTLFYQGYGRVDLAGGNSLQMALSLKRLLKLPGDVICYPGHGMKTKIAWEREANA